MILSIDTCGARGTLALGRLESGALTVLAERMLPSRNEASAILPSIAEMLIEVGVGRELIGAVVVVNGPGSFTGVRIGVSAALGIGEGLGVPIVEMSRLGVLAALAGTEAAAIDAHRSEVFLRLAGSNERNAGREQNTSHEQLANQDELMKAGLGGVRVAVCDAAAESLLTEAVPDAIQIVSPEPTAADAMRLAVAAIERGEFVEPLALDGNYLRRSDAEIFWGTR